LSKQVSAMLRCPSCGAEHNAKLYRSLWIEDPKNRAMVFEDRINVFNCPDCGHPERLAFSLLCTNKNLGFAVWYEPQHDPAVDKDVADYKKHLGPNSYFAKAPRIGNWEEFKAKIVELENSKNDLGPEISDEMGAAFNRFLTDVVANGKTAKKRPAKESAPWRRRLLLTWAVLSLLWVGGIAALAWNEVTTLNKEMKMDTIHISGEPDTSSGDKSYLSVFTHCFIKKYSTKKLEPGSMELTAARDCFPSFDDKSDAVFSDHLWGLIEIEVADRRYSLESRAEKIPTMAVIAGLIPSVSILALGLLIGKYPPSQLTPYTKKVIAIAITWVMSAGAWALISEEGDIYDAFLDGEYSLLFFSPPVVFVLAAVLWSWANRTSVD
jgi:hypothetical protein